VVSIDAYNGGRITTTIQLSCIGQPTIVRSLAVGQRVTITTGWAGACTSLGLDSSNGWDANFDNLAIKSP